MAAESTPPVFDPDADVLFDAPPLAEREPEVDGSADSVRPGRSISAAVTGEQPSRSANGRATDQTDTRTLRSVPDQLPPPGDVPPQSLEAEEHVLGAMMLAPGAIDAVSEILDPGDFYRESHAIVYRAALHVHESGEPVDVITLTAALEQRGELERAGGRARLHELARLVPATANARHYADIVRETATLRGLIRAGGMIAQLGWEREGEPDELVATAEDIVAELGHRAASKGGGYESTARQLTDTFNAYEAATANDGLVGVPTGFHAIDQLTAGLEPGTLTYLAARPSMGKSALALCVGFHVAEHHGPVAFAALEMSKRMMAQRLLCMLANVDLHRFRRGQLEHAELARVFSPTVTARIEKTPLLVDDTAGLTVRDLRARFLKVKQTQGLALAIVDHIQIIKPAQPNPNRHKEVSEISAALKELAKDLEVPVLALSQLNRNLEARVEKRPTLSDLRESGSLEQDGDLVMFLYREGVYNPDRAHDGTTEVLVEKSRNGPTGKATIMFVAKSASFTEMARMPGVVG